LGFRIGFFGRFLVRGHRLAVQVLDFEDVDGDSAAIASAGPLGILWDVRRERDEILRERGKYQSASFFVVI
jgi:hypothetical protein